MTEATCSIARLDRSRPPPGYQADPWLGGIVSRLGDRFGSLAEAWTHYEARHDPPGVCVYSNGSDCAGRKTWLWEKAAWAHYWRTDALAKRLSTGPFAPLTCECSKPPAAWGGRGASVCRHTGEYLRVLSTDFWPVLRGAHGSQLDEVDRWLAEGGELPEVLRA